MEDKDGNYWLGTWGEGLWQIVRTDNGRMKSIHHPIKKHKISDTEKRFFSLAQDHDGYIWAMAYNGLYRFKPDRHGKPPVTALLPPHIDADKMYTKIITGTDGNLWLSSYDGGTLVSFRNDRITEFPIKEMVDELNRTPNLLTLDKDKEGRFWFRTGWDCAYTAPTHQDTGLQRLMQGICRPPSTHAYRLQAVLKKTGFG